MNGHIRSSGAVRDFRRIALRWTAAFFMMFHRYAKLVENRLPLKTQLSRDKNCPNYSNLVRILWKILIPIQAIHDGDIYIRQAQV